MTILTIKNKDERAFYISLFKKIQKGWKAKTEPKKSFWSGVWSCEIEKKEVIKKKLEKKQTEI